MLTLAAPPDFPPRASVPSLDFAAYRPGPEGYYAVHNGEATTQLILRRALRPGEPIAALIPLDGEAPGRIEALTRFWRAWHHKSIPPDTRITAQRRLRLRLTIQAVDGRDNGASYREIAKAIFGESRVAAEPWKTAPLRDMVIGLVKSASALIGGGYLQLLRHRRRS